ncbi:YCF48-related protein [Flavobacterium chuncheonense]|uniref:YCF48-related protein n=1 Tax=Flavobacterium chuncheonense TaxID=2026653 RepID=A0ABW5YIQ9_9FLAO
MIRLKVKNDCFNPFFGWAVIFWFYNSFLFAQLQWQALTPPFSNTNNQRFDDVFFLNEMEGWALNGYYAGVYKTTDGGLTWVTQLTESQLGGNYYFRNIEFLNSQIGFVGTLNNKFYKTIDGGVTWSEVTNITTTTTPAICGLDAVGNSTIYGCGAYFSPAYVIKSIDSGATWQFIDMSPYAEALVEVLFLDENTGFVSGKNANGAVVLKTIDGGLNWTAIYNGAIQGEFVWKLQVLSSNSNVIFGSIEAASPNPGKLLKSIDGGQTWITKIAPESNIQAVGFMTENHGWMGGHTTGFYETFDGGDTWISTGVGSNLNRIFILNQNLAYASGTGVYKYTQSLGGSSFTEYDRNPLKVKIAPNPVNDVLTFSIEFTEPDHLVMELYDTSGKFLKQLMLDEVLKPSLVQYSFPFEYSAGVYFLNLHSNTGRQSLRFVKN